MYDRAAEHDPIREYRVEARRTASGTIGASPTYDHRWWPTAQVGDRAAAGRTAIPDPVELLLTAVAAAILAGAEEAAALLTFALTTAEVHVYAVLRIHASCPLTIAYDLTVDSEESEARLVRLHEELREQSPVLRLVAAGTMLNGRIRHRHG